MNVLIITVVLLVYDPQELMNIRAKRDERVVTILLRSSRNLPSGRGSPFSPRRSGESCAVKNGPSHVELPIAMQLFNIMGNA